MESLKICASDIEANNWIEFLMIGIYDGNVYNVFDSIKKYIDFILKNYSGYKIYFHNGGRYDFLFLFDELSKRGKLTFIEKAGGFISIKFSSPKCKVEFIDSYNMLPSSLEKLIETFNIKHKKIEIDFTKRYKYSNKKLHEHLENDCFALYEIIKKLYEKENKVKLTIASQAMNNFKEKFFNGYIWQSNNKFDLHFRKNYYRGGRVEVYKGYGENLYYYDFNSLYPYVMTFPMPKGSPIKTNKYHKNKIGYYKIKLLSDTNFLISPLIKKTSIGNYYINGNKNDIFYVMNTDLQILERHKYKFKVLSGYYFKESEKLFNNYVNHYYNIKSHAKDETERYIAKLMLNSLYGKFGQKLRGEKLEVFSKENLKKGKILDYEHELILVDRDLHVKFKGIHIACYITSLARYILFSEMERIGFNNIWYCDTDSIITNKKLQTSKQIGKLKLEHKIKEGVFLLGKTYGFIDNKNKRHVKYKGFKSNTFSYNELKKLLLGKKKELIQTEQKMLGFRSAIKRKNKILAQKNTFLKLVEQDKILSSNYTKRKVITDKKYIFITKCFNTKDFN